MALIALLKGGRRVLQFMPKGLTITSQFSSAHKNYWDTHMKEIGGVVRGAQSM